MNKRHFFPSIVFLLFMCLPLSVLAGSVVERTELRVPLTRIAPVGVVDLKGLSSSYGLKLPIPDRWEISSAVLNFDYVHSSTLIQERSLLVVRVNGQPAAQIPLVAETPQGAVQVPLPLSRLQPGYNDLEFSVAQLVPGDCVDPSSGDLWTTLLLDRAHIDFSFRLRPAPLSLASLADFFFDPRTAHHDEVIFLIQDRQPATLQAAALAAAGIALRLDYQPVSFRLTTEPVAGHDHVVIGSSAFVSSFSFAGLDPSQGAQLALRHLAYKTPDDNLFAENGETGALSVDPTRIAVLVSGDNNDELLRAATALAMITYPLPRAAEASIQQVDIPELLPHTGRFILQPGHEYQLASLGFSHHIFSGAKAGAKEQTFRLGSDLLLKPQKKVELKLKLAYGSKMREDSALNIFLNDIFVGAIPLDDDRGGQYSGYTLNIPAYVFKNGFNTLSFAPVLTPLVTGKCTLIQERNLQLTVYAESSIILPSFDRFVELPSLSAIFQDGYPFHIWPDMRDSQVFLPNPDLESVGAALNVVAMLAQKNGVPPLQLSFVTDIAPRLDRNTLVFGVWQELPPDLRDATCIQEKTPHLLTRFWEGTANTQKGGAWLQERFFPQTAPRSTSSAAEYAWLHHTQDLGSGTLLLAGVPSPDTSPAHPFMTMIVTAPTRQDLLAGSTNLWEPAVQGRIAGDTALILVQGSESAVWPATIHPRLYSGEVTADFGISAWLMSHPWKALTAFIIMISGLTLSAMMLLRRVRRNRLDHE
jgi:cellulose synthase operon protein B